MIIELPLVENFSEIDLEVSKKEIRLEVKGIYKLSKTLNVVVDNNNVKAKWDKKVRRLTLRLTSL